MPQTVDDFLNNSPQAQAVATLDIGMNRHVTVWQNNNDRVLYDGPQGHAFSLYLEGGTGTHRLDKGGVTGWPGTTCVLPEGHRSDWEIVSAIRLVHLYLPDSELRAAYTRIHDRDARLLDIQELTFSNAPKLARPLSLMAQAAFEDMALLADQAVSDLVGGLPASDIRLNGGLAPHILRRTDEWMDANLDQPIRLADLAAQANLSEYHFHHMFRVSRGVAPHHWLTNRRIDRAKAMLLSADISEVATACGFSSQSHLSRVFKRYTGLTPAAYRKQARSRTRKCAGTGRREFCC